MSGRTIRSACGSASLGVIAAMCLGLASCGPPATVLTGVVTLDGEAVPNAILEFYPVSGIGPVTLSRSDEKGRYTAVVAPTTVSVLLSATKVVGKVVDPSMAGGVEMDDVRDVLPSRYASHTTSGITAEPVAGKTTPADFHLKSAADH